PGGLENRGGEVATREALAHGRDVVGRQDAEELYDLGQLASLGLGLVRRPHADLQAFVPAVEVARELHDVPATRECTRQSNRHVGRLGARGREAYALLAGHEPADPLPPLDLLPLPGAVVRALRGPRTHGGADCGRSR